MKLNEYDLLRLFSTAVAIAVLNLACLASISTAQNLAGDPGFENGPGNTATWIFTGIAHISDGANAHTGEFEAQFSGDGSELGDVSQPITTVIGQQYLVTLWATSDGFGTGTGFSNSLDASFGSGSDDLTDIGQLNGSSRAPYSEYSFVATASAISTTLDISGQDFWGNLWIDDVSVTAVPEPASEILLATAGLGLLFGFRRRRDRRPATNSPHFAGF